MPKKNLVWMIPAAVTAALASVGTYAQQPQQPQQEAGGLEEIVVTARRREEEVQDVPLSIVALSGGDMEQRGLERVRDVIASAPNVFISAGPGGAIQPNFYMRGIPGAGFFVDDVWIQGNLGLGDRSVLELERVEILRGPQGTLFGRDTTGGAIRLYSRLPAEEFGLRFTGTVGSYDRRDLTANLDVPLSDTLRSKFTFSSQKRDGFIDSVTIDRSFGDIDDNQIRADFLWQPNDRFQARLIGDRNEQRGTQTNYTIAIIDPGAPGPGPGQVGSTPFRVPTHQYYELLGTGLRYECATHVPECPGGQLGDLQTRNNYTGPGYFIDSDNLSLKLQWDFNENFALSSLSAYQQRDSWAYQDFDNSDFDFFTQGSVLDTETVTQEFQLSGNHGRVNWVGGLYYWKVEESNRFMRWSLWEFAAENTSTNRLSLAAVQANPLCQANTSPLPCIIVPGNNNDLTGQEEEGYAAFGELTFGITDSLALTVGARYHEEDQTDRVDILAANAAVKSNIPGHLNPGNYLASAGTLNDISGSFDKITYRVVLRNEFTEDLSAYLGFSQGYNAGGVSRQRAVNPANGLTSFFDHPFDPETINNYEVGLRSDWLNGTLRFNATYFLTKWDDIQVLGITVNPFTGVQDGAFITRNGATGEAKGVEVGMIWLPAEQFRLDVNVGTLDTGYDTVSGTDLTKDTPFGGAPELQYSVGGQWDGRFSNGSGLSLRVDYNWTDGYNRHSVAEELLTTHVPGKEWEQDSFGLLNARLTFRPPSEKWELSLFGTNMTDERYSNGGFLPGILQIDDGTIGRPDEYGLTVKVSF